MQINTLLQRITVDVGVKPQRASKAITAASSARTSARIARSRAEGADSGDARRAGRGGGTLAGTVSEHPARCALALARMLRHASAAPLRPRSMAKLCDALHAYAWWRAGKRL